MIDYALNPEEEALKALAAKVCAGQIAPRARLLDESGGAERNGYMRENLQKLAAEGLLGTGIERESIDLISAYVVGEELAKACPATFISARASGFLAAGALSLFGTQEQKSAYLNGMKSADRIGALAYSESGAGSDLEAITAEAEWRDGRWVLNGEKDIVVNAPIADVFLILARTDRSAAAAAGQSLFVVEKDAPGLSIGESIDTMGLRGAPMAALRLDKCVAGGVLGDVAGAGFDQITRLLEMGRITAIALCVGIGTACMEKATMHAKARKAFGKPIGVYQEVGFKLADMFALNDLGRMMGLRSAWSYNNKESEAAHYGAIAKVFAGEGVTQVANMAMQIFAGHGYVKGQDIERLYRDARFCELFESTTELMRVRIAEKELDRFEYA